MTAITAVHRGKMKHDVELSPPSGGGMAPRICPLGLWVSNEVEDLNLAQTVSLPDVSTTGTLSTHVASQPSRWWIASNKAGESGIVHGGRS